MEEQETSMENDTHASKGPTTQSLKLLQSQWHIITTFNLKGEKSFIAWTRQRETTILQHLPHSPNCKLFFFIREQNARDIKFCITQATPDLARAVTLKCALCKSARAMCFNLLSIIKPAACLPSLLLIRFGGSISICTHSIRQHSANVMKTLSALSPIDGYRRGATLTHNVGAQVAHCFTLSAKLCLFSYTSTYMSVKNGK